MMMMMSAVASSSWHASISIRRLACISFCRTRWPVLKAFQNILIARGVAQGRRHFVSDDTSFVTDGRRGMMYCGDNCHAIDISAQTLALAGRWPDSYPLLSDK